MVLTLCMAKYEGELICDFAEYYHIYDYKGLLPEMAATLLVGLRDSSRVKMALAGAKITTEQYLLARIVDELSILVWFGSEDGAKKRNRPESITALILGEKKKSKDDVVAFQTADDFKQRWSEITGG